MSSGDHRLTKRREEHLWLFQQSLPGKAARNAQTLRGLL